MKNTGKINAQVRQIILGMNSKNGLSLTEVLIAMGVLTVGLLSVAAIFPVGGFYMKSGEVADNGSAIAQAAFNDIVTRGVLDPDRWLMVDTQFPGSTLGHFKSASGTITDGIALANSLPLNSASEMERSARIQETIARKAGSTFVIDPLGMAAAGGAPGDFNNLVAYAFPILWHNKFSRAGNFDESSPHWWTWRQGLPMQRVTLPMASVGVSPQPMTEEIARNFVSAKMDLVTDSIDTGASTQPWRLSNGQPLARQTNGNYSWIVTVHPTTPEARNALATDPTSHSYVVSVVVFHKRVVGDVDTIKFSERNVKAKVLSTGLSGGELLLERFPTNIVPNSIEPEESPFEVLNENDYVLLSGPHLNSTPQRPIFTMNWYRVVNIDAETVDDATTQRIVAIRGPKWSWDSADDVNDSNHISNDLRVGIFPGAVAVHTRTMRLEGDSAWGID